MSQCPTSPARSVSSIIPSVVSSVTSPAALLPATLLPATVLLAALVATAWPLPAVQAASPVEGTSAAAATATAATAAAATDAWDKVLGRFAVDGGVDYAALAADRADLDRYLASLPGADLEAMDDAERLAFMSNAYNALVVKAVLDRYPEIESVLKVDGFFDSIEHPVAGRTSTLDGLEAIGREIDPRIHFSVVCASTSCPDLRGEAYRPGEIDRQLDEQTRAFLADPSKGLKLDGDTLWLSSIFQWYADDFGGDPAAVVEWIEPYLPAAAAERVSGERVATGQLAVRYFEYDWSLNDR